MLRIIKIYKKWEIMTEINSDTYAVENVKVKAAKDRVAYYALKRIFDVVISVMALVILLPVYAIVAICIKLEDGGNVIYKQERIGKAGKAFNIYKFRSMKVNADSLENLLTKEQLEKYYKDFKLDEDPRITKVGDFIRKTSIDELPQLVNIIKGDMSIVGPRPVLLKETYFYGNDRDKVLSMRPGLTGYWQVHARNNADYKSGKRQQMELYYVDHCSFWLDVKLIFGTIGAVLNKTGK